MAWHRHRVGGTKANSISTFSLRHPSKAHVLVCRCNLINICWIDSGQKKKILSVRDTSTHGAIYEWRWERIPIQNRNSQPFPRNRLQKYRLNGSIIGTFIKRKSSVHKLIRSLSIYTLPPKFLRGAFLLYFLRISSIPDTFLYIWKMPCFSISI